MVDVNNVRCSRPPVACGAYVASLTVENVRCFASAQTLDFATTRGERATLCI